MKTSEFIKKVGEMGYQISNAVVGFKILDRFDKCVAYISRVDKSYVFLMTDNYQLIKLCIEYAETPIAEREDKKKYMVRIPDSPERTPVYALCKLVNGCVVINQTNESNFQEHDRYRLTESEIKRNHEYLWQFAKEVKE